MRISTDADYPYFHDWAWKVCRFYLAGSERSNVVLADEEKRYAITYRLDENGNLRRDKAGKYLTDEFRGDVRIECSDWLRYEVENGKPHPDFC